MLGGRSTQVVAIQYSCNIIYNNQYSCNIILYITSGATFSRDIAAKKTSCTSSPPLLPMAPKEKDCSNKTSGKAMVRRRSNSKSPAASPTRLGDLPDKLAPRAHPPPPRVTGLAHPRRSDVQAMAPHRHQQRISVPP